MGGGGGGGGGGLCFSCPLSAIPCPYIRVFHQRQACNCGKNCKSIHFARFSDCAALVTVLQELVRG